MTRKVIKLDEWQVAMCESLVQDKLNQVVREYPKSNDPDSPAWLLRMSLYALLGILNKA